MKPQIPPSLSTRYLQLVKMMWAVFNILTVSLLLSSCIFSENRAPSSDLSRKPVVKPLKGEKHQVKSGETLFSIAWRYGMDYKSLARMNGIGSDYLIYAGQSLALSSRMKKAPKRSAPPKATIKAKLPPRRATSSASVARSSVNVSRQSTAAGSTSTASSPRPEKKSSSKRAVTTSNSFSKVVRWQWPSRGKVITNFSSGKAANKGIDIRGKKGDSVLAAAAGKIVYAGSGLRGYGQLIIIKHNDTYLSAYAHNDRIRIREGQNVKAGQHIADIGSSGTRTESVKLHFEIRRNGQPINPLTLLPKRKS